MRTGLDRPLLESYWVLPDRLLAGEHPGYFDEEITRKQMDAFLEAGFDSFLDLTYPNELPPYVDSLRTEARLLGRDVTYLNLPIVDNDVPTHVEMIAILDALDALLAAGHKIYLHCQAGVGRTATAVGCYLVRHGSTGRQALDQIAIYWQGVPKSRFFRRSPESDEQVRFILNWRE